MAIPRSSSLVSHGMRLVAQAEGRHLFSLSSPATAPLTALVAHKPRIASSARPFNTSATLLKKRKIAPASNSPSPTPSSSSPKADKSNSKDNNNNQPNPEDPLDFSALLAAYATIDAHFKAQLQAVLHGGRFNPDVLGALPVAVKSHDEQHQHQQKHDHHHHHDHQHGAAPTGAAKTTFPLRELAQIVPRSGRIISLLVNEREYIKPIMSAVQASKDFNQQPQRSEDNELELLLRVEMERKEDLVRRVKEACQGWRERVRQARTKHEKALKEWKKNGVVLPDVVRKADKELQKVQDKKMKEIDAEEAQVIKQLDRR
ncbi:ribosome recycling factor [Trichoderma aethiopicum]